MGRSWQVSSLLVISFQHTCCDAVGVLIEVILIQLFQQLMVGTCSSSDDETEVLMNECSSTFDD